MTKNSSVATCVFAALTAAALLAPASAAYAASEQQSLEELRNTVVNLLQALVERGVMTREQASALVAQARDKASTDAAAAAAADEGAVRVTYVPEIVRQEISEKVAADIRPALVDDVVARARAEKWGVPAALPDWLSRLRWSGDIRLRSQADLYADGNLPLTLLDFGAINAAGGIERAGLDAFENATEDRYRLRVQARLALDAALGGGFSAGVRLVTGSQNDPTSANQTLGTYGAKSSVNFDHVFVRWEGRPAQHLALQAVGGRFANPWTTSELVWDRDVTFDGLAGTVRVPFGPDDARSGAYVTLGAHPLQEFSEESRDKWLYGAQLGLDLGLGDHRVRVASAYYDFRNVQGRRNAFDSTLTDYTAPRFLRRGNTLFDIRNDLAQDTNLFALAGKYELVDAFASWSGPLRGDVRFDLSGHYVRNIGWKSEDVLRNTGIALDERTDGYQVGLSVGHMGALLPGQWKAFFMYRYLQRDAILDVFADSDLRLGGTDAKGYWLGGEFGVTRGTSLSLRYITADEIDGTLLAVGTTQLRVPFGADSVQFDVNTRF